MKAPTRKKYSHSVVGTAFYVSAEAKNIQNHSTFDNIAPRELTDDLEENTKTRNSFLRQPGNLTPEEKLSVRRGRRRNHPINLINWKTREAGDGNKRLSLRDLRCLIQLLIRDVNLTVN